MRRKPLTDVLPVRLVSVVLGWGLCVYLYADKVSLVAKAK